MSTGLGFETHEGRKETKRFLEVLRTTSVRGKLSRAREEGPLEYVCVCHKAFSLFITILFFVISCYKSNISSWFVRLSFLITRLNTKISLVNVVHREDLRFPGHAFFS